MKNTKKGFTLVELLVVIAILAILATVAVVGYTSFIDKANTSADQQAVTQMNTLLRADEIESPTDIFGLFELLGKSGLNAEDYHPLTKDTYFYWDSDKNRIIYTDANDVVLYPEDYEGESYVAGTSNWYSLTLEIKHETVAKTNDNKYTITTAGQLAYLFEQINEGAISGTIEITVNGMLDMKGADIGVAVKPGSTLTIKGANDTSGIKNLASVTPEFKGDGTTAGHSTDYNYGFVRHVGKDTTAKIVLDNLVFENIFVKDTNASCAGLLIGNLEGGIAEISNVTIKNSTLIGHRNTGALIGRAMGSVKLDGDIKLENVQVKTVGGRSGLLMGLHQDSFKSGTPSITITNSSYGIYSCEQNTGVYTDKDGLEHKLGLFDGKMHSYTDKEGYKEYSYVADVYAMASDQKTAETIFDQYIN